MARATLSASQALVWETLTDYEGLNRFVPGMRESRVVERHRETAVVEERGEARFLMFKYPISVTVASIQRPPNVIEIHLLKGSLKTLEGAYRIEPLPDGRLVLHWNGVIAPAFSLPSFIGEPLMRANVDVQFRGMLKEIERRERTRRAG